MENCNWNLFHNNSTDFALGNNIRGPQQSGCCTSSSAWDFLDYPATTNTSRIIDYWSHTTHNSSSYAAHQGNINLPYSSSSSHDLYSRGGSGSGSGSHFYPDPHLMCLKLGKRHYFGDASIATALGGDREVATAAGTNYSNTKKGKPYGDAPRPSTSTAGVATPRCQVDGCHVALVNAKDYHRRHKVCEIHSKAPRAVVLGLEQRFCQQCSRFHAVSEFDETKRSCRRRLAGHNERRRKSSQEQHFSALPNPHSQVDSKLMTCIGRHPFFPLDSGCALSLLSSNTNSSWISSADFPTRCSDALLELIAENRAAILARQIILENDWQCHYHHPSEVSNNGRQNGSNGFFGCPQQMSTGSHSNWDRISDAEAQVTLDLMQAPNSAFGFLSMRGKSKEGDQECPELWTSFGGAHVV